MISRFFIDRPVLANVLALFFVVIGLVSLVNLPTSQYPNVVPPTVQVTTRYPGASASTLVNTVGAADRAERQRRREHALHAVDERERRHLQSHRHFRDRHERRRGRDPGAEPGLGGALVPARRSAAPGRDDEEAIDVDPRVRRACVARQPLRQPVPVELTPSSMS